jgi:hypothetical protein
MKKPTSRPWTVTRCDSFDDMRRVAIERWQKMSGSARRKAAWELVVEAWQIKKRNLDELRLQRPIKVVRKA